MENVNINGDKLRELFAEADVRIEQAEKARAEAARKAKEEAEKARQKVLKNTEQVAEKIVNLVYVVLTTADTKSGNISPELVSEYGLGKLTTRNNSASKYEVDGDGLKIVLDYSTESMDTATIGFGKCFIRKGNFGGQKEVYVDSEHNEIDYSYLIEKLSENDIEFNYSESNYSTSMSYVEHKCAYIKFAREKKKIEGKGPYTKQ